LLGIAAQTVLVVVVVVVVVVAAALVAPPPPGPGATPSWQHHAEVWLCSHTWRAYMRVVWCVAVRVVQPLGAGCEPCCGATSEGPQVAAPSTMALRMLLYQPAAAPIMGSPCMVAGSTICHARFSCGYCR
jgi:hypothetical protein